MVSVVIPTYNRANVVSRAIRSVLSQTYSKLEILVVDDGSTDDTQAILSGFPEIISIAQQNRGVSAARNAGIAASKGELIAFLDSDDEWLPRKLERQAQLYSDKNPDFICHTNEIWVRGDKPVVQKNRHLKQGGFFFERALERCLISPSAVMISRCLLDRVGWFDEELIAAEDYDLWLRITCSHRVDYLEEPLVIKRAGESNQLSVITPAIDRFRVRSIEKILREYSLSDEHRRAARHTLIQKSIILSKGCDKRGKFEEARFYSELAQKYSNDAY